MKKKELIKRCLIDKDAIETYPFEEDRYGEIAVLRHNSNNKWFGLVFEIDGKLYINLKAEPETILILREEFEGIITPAWHMNKKHWCKVDVNKVDKDVLDKIIRISFDLTAAKSKIKYTKNNR